MLLATCCSNSAVAEPKILGTFQALANPGVTERLFLSVATKEGIERFELKVDSQQQLSASLLHLRGESRPRGGRRNPNAVAASRIGDSYIVFFTSSRWGVPSSVSFSLVASADGLLPARVRVSRNPQRSLPCGSRHAHRVGRVASHEKGSGGVSAAGQGSVPFNPQRVLEVATRADYEFYTLYGANTNDYIAATVHAAEVLYAAPLGLRLRLVSQKVQTSGAAQPSPIEASSLLTQFQQQSMAETENYDVLHLFTGRALVSRTIGIAYVGTACSGRARFNIGLSRAISPPLQPLLFAHEIAHNLGSYHDSVPNSVMNPVLSANNNGFSQLSLAAMKSAISSRMRCIARLPDHDLSISLEGTTAQTFFAVIRSTSLRAEPCTVGLMAQALRNGRGFGPTYRVASRQVTLTPEQNPNTVTFSAPMPPGPTDPANIALFSRTWCRSRTYVSPSTVLQVGASDNGASSATPADERQWMLLLRSALGN